MSNYRADILEQARRIAARNKRILQEAVETAQASSSAPSATVGILADGISEWKAGTTYAKKHTLFVYDGKVGFTRQAGITALDVYPPFSVGTESLYGVRPIPDSDGVFPYVYNMAAKVGMKVRDNGVIYECIQAIDPMLYAPSLIPAHFKRI